MTVTHNPVNQTEQVPAPDLRLGLAIGLSYVSLMFAIAQYLMGGA